MLTQGECNRLKGINEALEDIIVRHYGEDFSEQFHTLNCKLIFDDYEVNKEEELFYALVCKLNGLKLIERNQREALNDSNKELDTGENK